MKKEFKVNETIVKGEETKQKMTTIHIETSDADIYVNGVLLWQRYEDSKFAKIPPLFRAFVADKTDYPDETGDGKIAADLQMKGFSTSALFFFPKNARSPIHVRMEAVTSLEELESDYIRDNTNINDETADQLTEEFKTLWGKIQDHVLAAGWKLEYSHDMSENCFGWWDVVFTQNSWNEEKFLSISKLFSDFNKRLDEVFEKYNWKLFSDFNKRLDEVFEKYKM